MPPWCVQASRASWHACYRCAVAATAAVPATALLLLLLLPCLLLLCCCCVAAALLLLLLRCCRADAPPAHPLPPLTPRRGITVALTLLACVGKFLPACLMTRWVAKRSWLFRWEGLQAPGFRVLVSGHGCSHQGAGGAAGRRAYALVRVLEELRGAVALHSS